MGVFIEVVAAAIMSLQKVKTIGWCTVLVTCILLYKDYFLNIVITTDFKNPNMEAKCKL